MKMKKESRLVSFLHQSIRVAFFIYAVWIAICVITLVVAMINPQGTPLRWGSSTTAFELIPMNSAPEFTAHSSDPETILKMDLLGYFTIKTGDWVYNSLILMGFLVWQGLYLTALNQLRLLFSSVEAGAPFISKNIRRIRIIGGSLLGGEMVRITVQFTWITYIKGTLSVQGARLSYLDTAFDLINLEVILAAFIILLISEVFKAGINLREEQELTI